MKKLSMMFMLVALMALGWGIVQAYVPPPKAEYCETLCGTELSCSNYTKMCYCLNYPTWYTSCAAYICSEACQE